MTLAVAAFYQFVALPDAAALREKLLAVCAPRGIKGTILLAAEGINGMIAGAPEPVGELIATLRGDALFHGRLAGLDVKLSTAEAMPFGRLKVRVKREIVTLGTPVDPTLRAPIPVEADEWNRLLDDPAVMGLDTRNGFEVAMGTFPGTVDPRLSRFGAFPAFAESLDPTRTKTVAMFCTGGIRCEKAGALLLARGVETVYTLEGGILRYLETMPAARSRWRGACFVFDGRVSLGHGLEPWDAADG